MAELKSRVETLEVQHAEELRSCIEALEVQHAEEPNSIKTEHATTMTSLKERLAKAKKQVRDREMKTILGGSKKMRKRKVILAEALEQAAAAFERRSAKRRRPWRRR